MRFDVAEVEKVVSELEKNEDLKISLSDLMRLNLQRFKKTGLSRRTIYERLTEGGLKLGTYDVFSKCWTRVEKSGAFATAPIKTESPVKADKVEEAEREREVESKPEPEEKAPEKPKRKPYTIRAADGTELFVDPETGAKTFEIKSSKKK